MHVTTLNVIMPMLPYQQTMAQGGTAV